MVSNRLLEGLRAQEPTPRAAPKDERARSRISEALRAQAREAQQPTPDSRSAERPAFRYTEAPAGRDDHQQPIDEALFRSAVILRSECVGLGVVKFHALRQGRYVDIIQSREDAQ